MADDAEHPQQRLKTRPHLIIAGIVLGVGMLYVVSWGPVAWGLTKWNLDNDSFAGRVVLRVVYPHLWMMSRSESYFHYSLWWAYLGRQHKPSESFADYQKHFSTILDD